MKKKKLPRFKSAQEEAQFWETHSVTDYIDQLEAADEIFTLSPALAQRIQERAKKRLVSIRLAEWEIEQSKQIAKQKKVPYQTLIREWIDVGLRMAHSHKGPG